MRLLYASMAVACWYFAVVTAAWNMPGPALTGILGGFAWLMLSLQRPRP